MIPAGIYLFARLSDLGGNPRNFEVNPISFFGGLNFGCRSP